MMPMTPSGTRTRWMCRPLGRVHSAATAPIGIRQGARPLRCPRRSPRRASRPAAGGRAGRRSGPRARAAAMSCALAARMAAASRAHGLRGGAQRRVLAGASIATASARGCRTAARPSPSISSPRSRGAARRASAASPAAARQLRRWRMQHQIVAMDHLVAAAEPEQCSRSRRTRGP